MLAIRDIITPRLSTADAKVITAFVLWIVQYTAPFFATHNYNFADNLFVSLNPYHHYISKGQ